MGRQATHEMTTIQVGGEAQKVSCREVGAFPEIQHFVEYLTDIRECKPLTVLSYARAVGSYLAKPQEKRKPPKGPVSITALKNYDRWRDRVYEKRLFVVAEAVPVLAGSGLRTLLSAELMPGDPWTLQGVALSAAQLKVVADAFYQAWGKDKRPGDVAGPLFGLPPEPIVVRKVGERATFVLAALTEPTGLAQDYANNAGAFVTDNIEEFREFMRTNTPDAILVSRRAAGPHGQAVHALVAEVLTRWVA